MFFRSLHIQRFKSLTDVSLLNLTPATVLVGQNAAGKSNIVEAIKFLISACRDGLDNAVTTHEGIEVIRQFSKNKPYDIRFRFEFDEERSFFDDYKWGEIRLFSADELVLSIKVYHRLSVDAEYDDWNYHAPTVLKIGPWVGPVIELEHKFRLAKENINLLGLMEMNFLKCLLLLSQAQLN